MVTPSKVASVDDLTALCQDPDLTLLFCAGRWHHSPRWFSPFAPQERVSAMWSASYHVTEETSRFIISTGSGSKASAAPDCARRLSTRAGWSARAERSGAAKNL